MSSEMCKTRSVQSRTARAYLYKTAAQWPFRPAHERPAQDKNHIRQTTNIANEKPLDRRAEVFLNKPFTFGFYYCVRDVLFTAAFNISVEASQRRADRQVCR